MVDLTNTGQVLATCASIVIILFAILICVGIVKGIYNAIMGKTTEEK